MEMSPDEMFVFAASGVVALVCAFGARGSLHALSYRANPGPGLVRLAVAASLVWMAYVLQFKADESVVGIYVAFYLVMGYAVVKLFGECASSMFGVSSRVDVGERRNMAAAVFVAAMVLSTGIIFGASLWGDADAVGDSEGGWYIPLAFFLLGWGVLAVTIAIYLLREGFRFGRALRADRQLGMAWGAGVFAVSTSMMMASAVSGDFFGWREGLKDVGLAGGMLLVHEVLRPKPGVPETSLRRKLETVIYLSLGLGNWAWAWLSAG